MIIVPLIPFRRRRKAGPALEAPAQTLVLVSAVYDEVELVLFLTFDRAVDPSLFAAAQVSVNDGSFNFNRYGGVGAAGVISPMQISVALQLLASAPVGPATLSATALTGITAVDDGGTWAGVSGLGLPFDG